jgi:hypothetical protein
VRRVSRFEELDAADINRIVVAINRNQIVNRRAALASAVAAFLAASSFATTAVVRKRAEARPSRNRIGPLRPFPWIVAMPRLCSGT